MTLIREPQLSNEARSQIADVKQQIGAMEADMAFSRCLDRKGRRDWIEASVGSGSRFVLE